MENQKTDDKSYNMELEKDYYGCNWDTTQSVWLHSWCTSENNLDLVDGALDSENLSKENVDFDVSSGFNPCFAVTSTLSDAVSG